tara:strand:- start:1616 stop:2326 length:711 start_codon:yes stop_codon:yes gene_type:complete
LISVVIPTYNEEKYLEKCIQSIRNCKTKDFEIVIVDGNSNDSTREIAKKLGCRIVLEKKTEGIGPARTKGIKSSKGEIVASLDADSEVCKGWLDIVEKEFNTNQELEAIGGPSTYRNALYDTWSFVCSASNYLPWPFRFYYLASNNSAYRRKAIEKNGYYRDCVHEDVDLSKRLNKNKVKMKYLNEMKVALSDRRFKERGFFRTLLYWGFASLRIFLGSPKSIKGYTYRYENEKGN